MTEPVNKKDDKKDDAKSPDTPVAKGSIFKGKAFKFALFGLAGVVVVTGVALATLFIVGGDKAELSSTTGTDGTVVDSSADVATDSLAVEPDSVDVSDIIASNLAALDQLEDTSADGSSEAATQLED
ncbi:MAG TPA: hypothetical protein VN285_12765, partial [Candidatus Deferrimicrobium sp.]|nr:hypothetical protein [Candidatus Deferrimicrobium sp.]